MKKTPAFIVLFLSFFFLLAGMLSFVFADKASTKFQTSRSFPIHTLETVDKPTQEVLEWYNENFGMVPNVIGIMAESPALVRSYWQLQQNLQQSGTLTPAEDNVVQMAIALENKCQYCVAGHSFAAKVFFKSPDAEVAGLRTGDKLPSARSQALRTFALKVNATQGRVSDEDLKAFLDAGFTRAQALDVVANIAAKVMTNFTNQLALTPTDDAFKDLSEGLPFAEERETVVVEE